MRAGRSPTRTVSTTGRGEAGQQIAYNGDSGDAEGIYHLHFEVHPNDGVDVNPSRYLNEATPPALPRAHRPTKAVTVGLKGMAVSAGGGALELSVTAVPRLARGAWVTIPARSVELAVPENRWWTNTWSTRDLADATYAELARQRAA